MKVTIPQINIRIDITQMTPADATEIYQIAENLLLETEWVKGDVACIVYFKSLESFYEFERIRPLA